MSAMEKTTNVLVVRATAAPAFAVLATNDKTGPLVKARAEDFKMYKAACKAAEGLDALPMKALYAILKVPVAAVAQRTAIAAAAERMLVADKSLAALPV